MSGARAAYDGFISYSHAADDQLAPRLQAGLQRFAKPWWQRRALRIFRDESSLSANPHLWSSITEALDEAGWFVLLLSPDAAQSEWVGQEVAYWLEHKDADRIIPVVTAGEFGWDGSDVSGDCVPEALRGVFESEPRWVDARELGDPETLDLQNPEFAAAVADLAAPLRGIPKDELAGEEVRQHKRTVRTAWAAGAVVLVFGVAAVGFAFQASRNAADAEIQTQIAQDQTSLAEVAATDAEEQTRIAEQALIDAEAQAARADRTADRLIEFILRPEDPRGRGGLVEVPPNPQLRAVIPTSLPEVDSPPGSTRLHFQLETCQGETCFKVPSFVREDPPSKTSYDLDGGTIWLADVPFHIRHGFEGRAFEEVGLAIASGHSIRAFITKVAGPDEGRFKAGVSYRVDASAALEMADDSCGPELYPAGPSEDCTQWVIDFPGGLPPGAYEFGLEWAAPCETWFETDVCPLPGKSVGLHFVGGIVSFVAENYVNYQDRGNVEWPFDPWSRSVPLHDDS